jgi:TRAP-type C4-dicarboxylate transport system substrate-binding protein
MKRLLSISLLILLVLSSASIAKPIVWKLGGVHAVDTPETIALYRFAELVEEKTGGQLTIEVYPAGQLGDAVGMIENTIMGAQQLFANVMDWNQHIVQDFGILAMCFAFRDMEHIKRFMETETYQAMEQEMIDEHGVRILAKNWYRLPRAIVTKDPVFSIGDIKGRQLRMPAIETYFLVWEALGANPIEIPWAESYFALERGLVEGMDSPIGSIYGMGFYKAAPFITNTRHLMAPFNILVNENAFQGLAPELRAALVEAGVEAGDYYTEIVERMFEEDKRKMLEAGAVYVEIDTRPFAEKAREVALDFEKRGFWKKGLYDEVQSLL